MKPCKEPLIFILINSVLLAAGTLIVLIACFQYNNYFPLLTILCDVFAILILMMCGSCSAEDDVLTSFDTDMNLRALGIQLSWMLFGLFIIFGYAVPSLLFRAAKIPDVALYFSWGGGTVILASMIIYLKVIYRGGAE